MVLILFGCSHVFAPQPQQRIDVVDMSQFSIPSEELKRDSFKVAMLLPLSGKASTYGQGLQNAAMMALEDVAAQNLEIRFYDTGSAPKGASEAFHEAVSNQAQMILGPLTSEEVSAISPLSKRENVPVISFSTSPQVLGGGIYTLGLLSDEQIRRIISYAAKKGHLKLALVLPDSASGLNMAKSAFDVAQLYGATVKKIGFYDPSTLEFSEFVQQMIATRDFDTVLIAETGNRLKAISGTFGYYDVSYPHVLFIGTSVWENTNLTKETTLYHAVYPTISRVHADYFNAKYKDLFGSIPSSLYAYAYDAVALASVLSTKDVRHLNEYITSTDGYIGINGIFKINPDGTNMHRLDIVEVTQNGLRTVDAASQKFEPETYQNQMTPAQMPEIFGKDAAVVYQKLAPQPLETPYFFRF